MTLKRILGYGLTGLVAYLGMIWYPLQSIAAVKPFVKNDTWQALVALNFSPISLFVFAIAITVAIRLVVPWRTSTVVLWGIWSAAGPGTLLLTGASRQIFLEKQTVGSGPCAIISAYATGTNSISLVANCGEKQITIQGQYIVNELLQNRKIVCTTTVSGLAACKP